MASDNIHWFPGHMAKTLRRMAEKLPQVDAVVQLLDARVPYSSINPALQELYGNKPRLYVLNKADLADVDITAEWIRYFKGHVNYSCVAINSKQKGAFSPVKVIIEGALTELFERRRSKGMDGAKTKVMVTGIPNVGKSTFINNWVGAAHTKAEDRPGVTRGEQWIAAGSFDLLDVPGVLWKKFDDANTALNLALTGSIPDRLFDTVEIAAALLMQMASLYPSYLCSRYKLQNVSLPADGWALLELAGRKRGMLLHKNEVDLERAAAAVLDDFRAGKLGRLSLERPEGTP